MSYRLRGFMLFLLAVLFLPRPVSAQTEAFAQLVAPQTEAFPWMEAFVDVHDAQGNFIHGLKASDFQVVEDGQAYPVETLSERRPGAQFVVVLNPGESFAVRDSQGFSRYDYLVDALGGWAKTRLGSTLDDWSLLTTGGAEVTHVSDPGAWIATLNSGQVDARSAVPNLDTLFRALDLAADPSPRPGMGRGVLFITPPLDEQFALSLENLISQARQQQISVSVWMVSSEGAYPKQAEELLASLAIQTGGKFLIYTGKETIPSPDEIFNPLRNIYQVGFTSRLLSGGAHQLAVEVRTPEGNLSTSPYSFELDLQPPNPTFVTSVLEIRRKSASETDGKDQLEEAANYFPRQQSIQILVDFPDERVRPLVRTSLFVDGEIVAENINPPFDQFTWNLDGYNASSEHVLRVEAEDVFGLKGASIEKFVQIVMETPGSSPISLIYRNVPTLVGLVVVLAGSVLLLVLVVGGRITPPTFGRPKKKRRTSDPVTQPVVMKSETLPRRLPNWVNRFQWPQRHTAPQAFAFLNPIPETGVLDAAGPIPVTSNEITFGSNPNQAVFVLNDPSVEELHARMLRKEDGSFRLADEGSVAGTWVNFTPVSNEGVRLEHGDLVHIGRIGFRFTLRQPTRARKPVVKLEDPHKDTLL